MRTHRIASLVLAGMMTLGIAPLAVGDGGFGISVEVDGRARPEYRKRGTVYVEALRDREYAIRITNPLPCRVAVALAVDGLNTIDAKRSTPGKASKWVLGPYESLVISGWQVDGQEARHFYFTGEKDSYGAWLGQTDNLGVIEAVFFREKERPRPIVRRHWPWMYDNEGGKKEAPRSENAPSAPAPSGSAREQSESKSSGALSDDYAATGIGDRTNQPVEWVHLDLESSPTAVVRVRYEFRPQLVQLGILPRPYPVEPPIYRREEARGFSGSYCPDPNDP